MGKIEQIEVFLIAFKIQNIVNATQRITTIHDDNVALIKTLLNKRLCMAAEIRVRERFGALEILFFPIKQTSLFTECSEELDGCIFAAVMDHARNAFSCSMKAFTRVTI